MVPEAGGALSAPLVHALRGLSTAITAHAHGEEFVAAGMRVLQDTLAAQRALLRLLLTGEAPADYDSAAAGSPKPENAIAQVREAGVIVHWPPYEKSQQDAVDGMPLERHPLLSSPLLGPHGLVGVVVFERAATDSGFTADDRALLTALGPLFAAAVLASRRPAAAPSPEQRHGATLMAAGFAHELRNALSALSYPLPVIASTPQFPSAKPSLHAHNAALLLELSRSWPQNAAVEKLQENNAHLLEAAQELASALSRSRSVTEQIILHARQQTPGIGADNADLEEVVRDVIRDNERLLATNGIHYEVAVRSSGHARIAPDHAYAIVRNLLNNAKDAITMGERPSADRRIKITIDGDEVAFLLTVADTGMGMTAAQAARVFEPFFTTKGVNGTGLGLGLSRQLAKACHGDLDFVTKLHGGTTFRLRLPRAS